MINVVVLSLLLAQDSLSHVPEATKADLAELKALVLRDLKDTKAARFANGRPDSWRVYQSLQLACGWTDPNFIPPLLKLLEEEPSYRLHAAACLIRYEKPDLNRQVAAHSKHEHTLGGGCFIERVNIQGLLDNYQKSRTMPSMLDAANIEENLIALQNGDPPSRLKAWSRLARHRWFAPWREYELHPTSVWRAAKSGDANRVLRDPIIGIDRARDLLALVLKDRSLNPQEVKALTVTRWRLGCDEEAPACREILRSIATELADDPKPDYEAYAPLYDLCARPDPGNYDLYRRLIGRPSPSLRSLGWQAMIRLDRDETFKVLEAVWSEPNQQTFWDSYDVFRSIADLGELTTPNRERWLDWLLQVQPKFPVNSLCGPYWIDAMSSMAGRDFGPSGRYIPAGFDRDKAQKTIQTILEWDETERRR